MTQARRVRLVLRRIEPWTVLKFSLLLYASLYLVLMVAAITLWAAASVTGLRGNVESFVGDLVASEDFHFQGGELLRASLIGGTLLVLLGSGVTVLLSVLHNLISDLIGGFGVVFEERPTRRADRKASAGRPPSRSVWQGDADSASEVAAVEPGRVDPASPGPPRPARRPRRRPARPHHTLAPTRRTTGPHPPSAVVATGGDGSPQPHRLNVEPRHHVPRRHLLPPPCRPALPRRSPPPGPPLPRRRPDPPQRRPPPTRPGPRHPWCRRRRSPPAGSTASGGARPPSPAGSSPASPPPPSASTARRSRPPDPQPARRRRCCPRRKSRPPRPGPTAAAAGPPQLTPPPPTPRSRRQPHLRPAAAQPTPPPTAPPPVRRASPTGPGESSPPSQRRPRSRQRRPVGSASPEPPHRTSPDPGLADPVRIARAPQHQRRPRRPTSVRRPPHHAAPLAQRRPRRRLPASRDGPAGHRRPARPHGTVVARPVAARQSLPAARRPVCTAAIDRGTASGEPDPPVDGMSRLAVHPRSASAQAGRRARPLREGLGHRRRSSISGRVTAYSVGDALIPITRPAIGTEVAGTGPTRSILDNSRDRDDAPSQTANRQAGVRMRRQAVLQERHAPRRPDTAIAVLLTIGLMALVGGDDSVARGCLQTDGRVRSRRHRPRWDHRDHSYLLRRLGDVPLLRAGDPRGA